MARACVSLQILKRQSRGSGEAASGKFQVDLLLSQPMWGVLKTIGVIIVVFIAIFTIFDLVSHRRD
jgi:hypothetical protein